jgi:O-antigen/teichoic acid export membrane protein
MKAMDSSKKQSLLDNPDVQNTAMSSGRSPLGQLLSGGVWVLGGRLAAIFLGFAFSVLLTRLLYRDEVGSYFLIFAVVTAGSVIAGSGFRPAAVRFAAESGAVGRTTAVRNILYRTGFLSVLLATLCAAVLWLGLGHFLAVSVFKNSAVSEVIGLLGLWVLLHSTQLFLSDAFRGLHDMRRAVLLGRSLPTAIALPVLVYAWIKFGNIELRSVLLIMLGACLLSVLLTGAILLRKIGLPRRIDSRQVSNRQLLHTAWPMLINGLAFYLLDHAVLWIVGGLRPVADVAIYGAAARLALLMSVFQIAVSSAAGPVIAELNVCRRRKEMEISLRSVATMASLPATLILLIFLFAAGPILQLVFGPDYVGGAAVLRILSLALLFRTCTGTCGQALTMTGHHVDRMLVSLLACVLAVAGGIWGVQHFGLIGGAIAATSAIIVQRTVLLVLARKRLGIWTHVSPVLLPRLISQLADWRKRKRDA